MSTLKLLCGSGDSLLATWDTTDTSVEGRQAVAAAEKILNEQRRVGNTVFVVKPGEPAVRFDGSVVPTEQVDLAVVPRLVGGDH